jgi:hypothetical protein
MASLTRSAALPWMTVLTACRSASVRSAWLPEAMLGSGRRRPLSVLAPPLALARSLHVCATADSPAPATPPASGAEREDVLCVRVGVIEREGVRDGAGKGHPARVRDTYRRSLGLGWLTGEGVRTRMKRRMPGNLACILLISCSAAALEMPSFDASPCAPCPYKMP